MRKPLTILLLLTCMAMQGQKSNAPALYWRVVPAGEIPAEFTEYSPIDKGKLLCFLSNDNENLYVDLVIVDPAVQKKVLEIGMNVWIDTGGKKNKTLSARYPVGANTVRNQLVRKGERMTDEERALIFQNTKIGMAREVYLNGFGEGAARVLPARSGEKCNARIYYNDEGDLIYFLAIPMADIKFEESKGKIVPFSVGIEYGVEPVIPRPQPSQAGADMAGGRTTGGGRPGGGAMPQQASQSDASIWIKGLLTATTK